MRHPESRREFLEHLGVAGAVIAGTGARARRPAPAGVGARPEAWDMSWVDLLKPSRYRAVVDASVIEDGYAPDLARGLIDTYHEVHGTGDQDVGIVIVARRGGTPLVFDDTLWEKFPLGEETKITDGSAPARRNLFYRAKPGASPESAGSKLENLQKRGVILLVCSVAANNWSRSLAKLTNRDQDEVHNEILAHLVPGTRVMPSGVFALMRAQNAGCAYMRGQ